MYGKKRNLDLTSEYISAVNRTQLITQQWDLHVELVGPLKHAGADGKIINLGLTG